MPRSVSAGAIVGFLSLCALAQPGGSPQAPHTAQRARTASLRSPKEIATRSFLSVTLVVVNDTIGQPTALGSGFFVAPGIVATNLHVIEGPLVATSSW